MSGSHLTSGDPWYNHAGIDITGVDEGYIVAWSKTLKKFIVKPGFPPGGGGGAPEEHTHDEYLLKTGGEVTGQITVPGPTSASSVVNRSYVDDTFNSISHSDLQDLTADNHTQYIRVDALRDFTSTPRVNGNVIWHEGNDGPGTGLNADLVDGQHASAFAQAGHTHAESAPTGHNHDTEYVNESDHTKVLHDNLRIDAETLSGLSSAQFLRSDTTDTANGLLTFSNVVTFNHSNEGLEFRGDSAYFGTNADARIIRLLDQNGSNGNVDGGLVFQTFTPTDEVATELLVMRNNVFTWKGDTILHAGIHGGTGDPHPQYQTQTETDARYLRSNTNTTYTAGTMTFASGTTLDVGAAIAKVATPVSGSDAANKAYVDAVVQGLSFKDSVRAVAINSVTRSGTTTIDGIALGDGDRVLLAGQSTQNDNGIWIVRAGAWERPVDFDADNEITEGTFVFVEDGTQFNDTGWVLGELVGSFGAYSQMSWTQFSGAADPVEAGDGLSKAGNIISVGAGTGIIVGAETVALDTSYTDGLYVNDDGDTITGALNFKSSTYQDHIVLDRTDNIGVSNLWYQTVTFETGSDSLRIIGNNQTFDFRSDGVMLINGNNVWHAGNMGSGSTLNADLVDGLHASQFLRSDAVDTANADITFLDSSIRLSSTSASYGPWFLSQSSSSTLQMTITGTNGPELELSSDGLDYTQAVLTVGGSQVLTGANHVSVGDPHTQYLKESDFTKSTIDALNVDADTVDGLHASQLASSGHNHDATYINEADHTKAAHDALGIDAATLDGIDSDKFVQHLDSNIGTNLAYRTEGGSPVGAYVIHTNVTFSSWWLDRVVIDLYEYAATTVTRYIAGVYAYSGTDSVINHAYLKMGMSNADLRWGRDPATDKLLIIIGDVGTTWAYPKLSVSFASWVGSNNQQWVISRETDLSAYTIFPANKVDFWHSGNDGSGSGLDADFLDGQHASAFAPISHNHAAADITSGVFANARIGQAAVTQHQAALSITESQITDLDHYTSADFDVNFAAKSTTDLSEGTNLYYTTARANSAIDARVTKSFVDTLNVDADTLDGIDSGGFLRSNAADTWTGKLTWGGGASAGLSFGSNTAQLIDLYSTGYGIGVQSSTLYLRTNDRFSVHEDGEHSNAANDPGTGGVTIFTVTNTEIKHGSNTIWTAGNDGAGSGLDADTVDGQHASAFSLSGHTHAYSPDTHNHDSDYINEVDHTKATHDALNIDADTVDGQHASAFATSGHTHAYSPDTHNHDTAYVNTSGDSMTGDLLVTHGSANIVLGSNATSGDRLRLHRSGSDGYIDFSGRLNFRAGGSGNALVIASSSNAGFGTSTPEETVDVAGNMRVREENSTKYGGVGASDAAFAIHYNASTNSLDFDYVGA